MVQIRTDEPAFPVFCQLIAALGQGAGTMNITAPAMSFVITQYWPRLSQEQVFDDTLLEALEFARGLGRLAAHRALAAGVNGIRPEDIESAADALRQRPHPFGRCPFC